MEKKIFGKKNLEIFGKKIFLVIFGKKNFLEINKKKKKVFRNLYKIFFQKFPKFKKKKIFQKFQKFLKKKFFQKSQSEFYLF